MKKLDILFLSAVIAIVASCLNVEAKAPDILAPDSESACARWVDSVYNSLSARDRVAQLICPKVAPNQGVKAKEDIRRYVGRNHVGALLFSAGTIDEYIEMTNYARSLSKTPLLMTFDGEWGLSMRIAGTTRFPKNMALGAVRDPELLYQYGREMARQCRLMSIQVNFAPVLDVNSNPSNPVIGIRSFGEDPKRVAELGTAYSRGLEDGGVMAVAKHFPGHGDTSTDSHHSATVVNHTGQQLDEVDLVPFRSFIDAGCSGVMTGHLVLPLVDKSGLPASMSEYVTTGIIRNRMGFDGLIFTDALGMKGAAVNGRNNAVMALKAGADVLESSHRSIEDLDAIMAAIASGEISPKIIEDRCKRVLRYKYILGLTAERPIEKAGISRKLNSPEAEALNRKLTAATMTLLQDKQSMLPVGGLDSRSVAVVNIGAPADNTFSDYCADYTAVDRYACSAEGLSAATIEKIRKHDIVIAGVYSDKPWAQKAFAAISDCKRLATAFFMTPYRIKKFLSKPTDGAILLAYEDTPLSQEYAAQALFGGIDVDGILPVNLPGFAKTGTGIVLKKSRLGHSTPAAVGLNPSLPDSLDATVKKLIADGGMPGCQLLIAKNGDIVYDKAFGHTTAGGHKVSRSTLYDLASVSKAAGTLPGLMKAYDMGLYGLDDRLSDFVPGMRTDEKKDLKVREFLYHETGMPASLNMYDIMTDPESYTGKLLSSRRDKSHTIKVGRRTWGNSSARLRGDIVGRTRSDRFPVEADEGIFVSTETYDTLMHRIYDIPLRDKSYRYSCLNFCLLMDMEQRLTGQAHDAFVRDSIFRPLGAASITYRPRLTHALTDIAPTERDRFLRRQLVHGYVHDELANFSGGVQGNAGLFSNARDLAKLCQMWLNGGVYGDRRILSEETVRLFTTSKSPTCRRGLGFDKPNPDDPDKSPTCEEADPSVYGHLGFTGTVFWVDPAHDLIFIFLTNRINPTRETPVFNKSEIRPNLFRLVCDALS